jgi:hypothetical protein
MLNEANTIEDFIGDLLSGSLARTMHVARASYDRESVAQASTSVGWTYIPAEQLARAESDVLVEAHVREALITLNPEIAEKPERADEGCGCDVYSPGELNVALRAGVAPQLISVNGVPKDAAHIRHSIQVGARLTIDSVGRTRGDRTGSGRSGTDNEDSLKALF